MTTLSKPERSLVQGEISIGIGFLHDYSLVKAQGAELELIAPCEGTGYELGYMSIINKSPYLKNAKLFVDWAMSKEGQENIWKNGGSFQILTNTTAETSPLSLKLESFSFIDYDMDKYSDPVVRKHLIDRWLKEVKTK